MLKRPLLPLVTCAVVLLIAMNLLMGFWNHRLPYYRLLEKVRTAAHPNILFVGNSLLASLDESAVQKSGQGSGADLRPINSAIPGSSPPEHELMFDYASQKQPDLDTLVLGFFDFQMTHEGQYALSDLVGNRMIAIDRRFAFADVVSAYRFGTLDQAQLQAARIFPMFANRANAWKYVELLRRSMSAMGMPRVATNGMGRVNDFTVIEPASPSAFDEEASSFLRQPMAFNRSYALIFESARRKGMRAVIVVMPMSPYHRSQFYSRPKWKEYLAALQILNDKHQIQVIDASDWFLDEADFRDHLHMTPKAMIAFSTRLGSVLALPTK